MIRTALVIVATVAAGSVMPAAQAQVEPKMPAGKPASSDVVLRRATSPIAVLRLPSGATIEFVDVGDGDIGVGERTPAGRHSLLPSLTGRSGGTPLEIFIALAPGTAPPAALVANHEAGARSGGRAAPRPLTVDPGVLHGIGDPGIDDYDCETFGTVF
jgi:hypothetical protein